MALRLGEFGWSLHGNVVWRWLVIARPSDVGSDSRSLRNLRSSVANGGHAKGKNDNAKTEAVEDKRIVHFGGKQKGEASRRRQGAEQAGATALVCFRACWPDLKSPVASFGIVPNLIIDLAEISGFPICP